MNEKEILEFWKEHQIYEKSVKKNSEGKGFYFMDGPPYATGHIHMGTALNKILKDIAMRSKRLQGFDVFDRPGYDTHGLPIEFQVEKEIGSKSKDDIKKYGVKEFVTKCKAYATKYIHVMNDEFSNLGIWMDWKNPYITLRNEYIETIWNTFKKADEKGLLYLGKYPVHVCPRCETAVAFNEIEYAKQDDKSIFVKFPLKNKENTFLIIWTTTPWTLPGNTGVMVNPEVDYQEVEYYNGEKWIIAEPLVEDIMNDIPGKYKILNTFKGKEMEGWNYENPLSKHIDVKVENSYRVVLSSRYVTTEEGTGLVHTAPGHGKEDYEVGKKNNLAVISPVAINGMLTDEAGKYAGKKARVVDEEIISDLKKDGFLVATKKYNHDYPHCWRCKTPLLMISQPQWFFRINEIQDKLLRTNKEVNWVPKYMELRMNAWLEGISDWPISRDRYWGTPLPIWLCDKCDKKEIIGSIKELEKKAGKKIDHIHKPEIDDITWDCNCPDKGRFKRVSEVLDVWFDSGVSSWAALDYMKDDSKFKKFWPADLNLEGKDQIRGWWNGELILSEIKFNKKPFKNILVHGMVLDLGKKKMSKSLGNVLSPKDMIEKFSRDYLRYYFAKISKGEDFAFKEEDFKDVKRFFNTLMNVNTFTNQLSVNKSQLKNEDKPLKKVSKEKQEDKWILSKFYSLVKEVIESYDNYLYPDVVQKIERFLIEDLSRNYIKIIRDRQDKTYDTLNEIRINLLKLLAPIIPFTTESIWQELKNNKIVEEESIHLSEFPKYKKEKIDVKLENNFNILFEVIEAGLSERDRLGVGLKWPLAKASIEVKESINEELHNIIKEQLNIKEIEINIGEKINVKLDTNITPELEAEGFARYISRNIQGLRKKIGLVKEDNIELGIFTNKDVVDILLLNGHERFISERTNAKKILITFDESELHQIGSLEKFTKDEFRVKGKLFNIYIRKI